MTENKFSKYLIYAMGEIFLVVIGILIALQVNNWNIERENEVKKKILSENLLLELYGVRNLMEDRLAVMENQQKITTYLVNNIEINMDTVSSLSRSGDLQIDPLNFLFTTIVHFNPRGDIYNSAINDGTLALLESTDIIRKLNTAYTMSAQRISDHVISENSINALINEHISNEYQNSFTSAEMANHYGAWDKTTTLNILKKISRDGKLKYLLSTKLQILQFKYGDLRYRIFPTVEKSIEYFEQNKN